MKRREEMNFLERLYLLEVLKGVCLTSGRLIGNMFNHLAFRAGLRKQGTSLVSIQYPDERRNYPPRYRGRHRLTLYPDGSVKCTACYLCATACPAKCIYIEPAEHQNPNVEKYPARYEIDTLLCIYCGYCVEACPVDAIRMDTGIHPEVYQPDPRNFIEDKELLMARSKELEEFGPDDLYRKHMEKMRDLEKHPLRDLGYSESANAAKDISEE